MAEIVLGVWLIVVGGPLWPIVFGLLLLGVAALIRPRFGRLRPMLKTSYRPRCPRSSWGPARRSSACSSGS